MKLPSIVMIGFKFSPLTSITPLQCNSVIRTVHWFGVLYDTLIMLNVVYRLDSVSLICQET